MTKFEAFIQEYKALCIKHKMEICASYMDSLQVHDLTDKDMQSFQPEEMDDFASDGNGAQK